MPARNAEIGTSVGVGASERLEAVRHRPYRLHADLYIHVLTLATTAAVRIHRKTPAVAHG